MIEMLPKYQRIFSLRLAGMQEEEIAAKLGISVETFQRVVNGDDFVFLIPLVQARVTGEVAYDPILAAKLIASDLDPMQKYKEIVEDESASHAARIQALREILDRAYGKTPEKIEVTQEDVVDKDVAKLRHTYMKDKKIEEAKA